MEKNNRDTCLGGGAKSNSVRGGYYAPPYCGTPHGGVLHWFALGHKHHLMDVALAESYGWVKWWPFKTVSRKKKSKPKPKAKSRKGKEKAGKEDEDVEEEEEEKQELWCICNQVFVGSGHGLNCVVVIH